MKIFTRWMLKRDIPTVLAIDRESFVFWWPEERFIQNLRQRNCIGIVAECDKQIVGFMLYDLNKHDIQLLRMAVDPDFLRQGIGTKMINKLKGKLTPARRHTLRINVPDGMLGAQLFFKAVGMRAVEVLESEYVFEYKHPELVEV